MFADSHLSHKAKCDDRIAEAAGEDHDTFVSLERILPSLVAKARAIRSPLYNGPPSAVIRTILGRVGSEIEIGPIVGSTRSAHNTRSQGVGKVFHFAEDRQ